MPAPFRPLVLAVLGTLLGLGAFGQLASRPPARSSATLQTVAGEPAATFDGLPLPVQIDLSRQLGETQARYHFVRDGDGFMTMGTGGDVMVSTAGLAVGSGGDRWLLRTRSVGRTGRGRSADYPSTSVEQVAPNRLEVKWPGVTEWFVNGPAGLQQGWTLAERPEGDSELELVLTSSRDVAVAADGGSVTSGAYRYGGLLAYDATGRELDARMEAAPGGLVLRVDDEGAIYPVVVDPFLSESRLTASDVAVNDNLGFSLATSADGGTIAAGTYLNNGNRGAVYVYVRPGAAWPVAATQSARLTASDGELNDYLGWSVAMSADGGTIAAGARGDDNSRGSIYVYIRPGATWPVSATQTTKLTASDAVQVSYLGISVSVSGNGATIAAGAPGDASNQGAVYVFVKPGTIWPANANQTAKLAASDGTTGDRLGTSVAVSSDGATIAAGASGDDSNRGSAYVYIRPGATWPATISQTAKLTASDGVADDQLGSSIALSGDGGTVAAGAVGDDTSRGAAYVYVRPGAAWPATATQIAKLTASDGVQVNYLGNSIAVSTDGGTIAAGAHGADVYRGAVYVFIRPGGVWPTTATQTAKLTANDGAANDSLGISVAVSGDGSTIAGGAQGDDSGRGSISVFATGPPTLGPAGLAAFGSSPAILGQPTLFAAAVTTGTASAFSWSFGDASPGGSGPIVQHTYAAPGAYTATVTASNAFGTLQKSVAVTVVGPPQISAASAQAQGSTAARVTALIAPRGADALVAVDYGTSPGGPYPNRVVTSPSTVPSLGASVSNSTPVEAVLTGLATQTTYYLKLRSANVAGETGSAELTVTTEPARIFVAVGVTGYDGGW